MDGAPPPSRGSALEVFGAALRLGLTSFGGPIAHIGYFRAHYVVRRRWLDDRAFSELVGFCQFLPGPASSQLGFAIGWMRAGAPGALAAWIGFTLPSALLMLGFGLAARRLHGPFADAAVHGLKLAAIAVVAQAIIGMARTLTPDARRVTIAALAAAAMLLSGQPAVQILLILLGAVAGLAVCEAGPRLEQHREGRAPARVVGMVAFALFAALALLLPAATRIGGDLGLAAIFYRAGALVFGGGHVVLPLLREGLVPQWMDDSAFLAGYGAAQAAPGPLFSVAAYLGAAALPAAPLMAAAVAILAIFLPGLLLITGALAFRRPIMDNAQARRGMAGVNAVVVGLLAAAFYDPLLTTGIIRASDVVVAAVGLFLLWRLRTPPLVVVVLCVAASVLLR